MKNWAIILLLSVATAGCKNEKAENPTPDAFMLEYATPLNLARVKDHPFTMKLVEVKDSRCPRNVVCIQMGWVALTLEVTSGDETVKVQAVYYANPNKDQDAVFTIGGYPYAMTIHDVQPYPDTSKNPKLEDYSISVSVKRLYHQTM